MGAGRLGSDEPEQSSMHTCMDGAPTYHHSHSVWAEYGWAYKDRARPHPDLSSWADPDGPDGPGRAGRTRTDPDGPGRTR